MKGLIVVALIAIIAALGSAGAMMLRHKPGNAELDRRMARALAVRVGISVTIFLFVLLAWAMGWIQPTGFTVAR
jgi:hypothetical protein